MSFTRSGAGAANSGADLPSRSYGNGLASMFSARSVAIVGASPDTGVNRGRILANLKKQGFTGECYPINPNHASVLGVPAYPTLKAVPSPIDLAMIMVPSQHVAPVLQDCADIGVKSVVIFSSANLGESDGMEADIARIARPAGMRVLGPNCEGFINVSQRLAATFALSVTARELISRETAHSISIVSQSGSISTGLLTRAQALGLNVDKLVSVGNEADIDCLEVLDFIVAEGKAKAVILFIEGFKDATHFTEVASRAADAGVALIVLKVGRSEAGSRAAVSHTAHLTGSDEAYGAIFDRFGIIRAGDLDDALAIVAAFALGKSPRGRRVGILSATGGFGGLAADICAAHGLTVPKLSEARRAQIAGLIPAFASPENPVDMTSDAFHTAGVLETIMDALDAGDDVDMLIVIRSMSLPGTAARMQPTFQPAIARSGLPVLYASSGNPEAGNIATLADCGTFVLALQHCARGLAALADYADFRRRWRAPVRSAATAKAAGTPRDLLDHYAIPLAAEALATSPQAARAAADAMGYPVAVKIASPDIAHKTDAGGVVLNVADGDAVQNAYADILKRIRVCRPDARIEGIQVQKMLVSGLEMVVGVSRDPDFGPLLMLGFGGIFVDILGDVALSPVPVSRDDALRMIGKLRGARILDGARGQPPLDAGALADLLVNVSRMIEETGAHIRELDLNPVILYPQGLAVADYLLVTE